MNKIILIGRLTKKPELRYTKESKPVATFTLAVNREFTRDGEQAADFINIVAWSNAENIEKYLDKGSQAAVDGRLQLRNYEDEKGKHYVTEVIANRVEFLGTKVEKETTEDVYKEFGEALEVEDSELPF